MTDLWVNHPSSRRVEQAEATIYALPPARAKSLERARRVWPEATAEDFERVGRNFVDKASGTAYRRVGGDPLLGGANREDVDTFYVADGLLVYLRRVGNPGHVLSSEVGEMGGRQGSAHEFVTAVVEGRAVA